MGDRRFPQVLTWWARSSSDGYGGYLFSTPILLPCRWEDKQVLFRNRTGDEEMSAAMAWIDREVEIGDYLCKGDWHHVTNPTLLDDAYEIKQFTVIPDLRALREEFKAIM